MLVFDIPCIIVSHSNAYMGHHIIQWAKLNFVARHYDPHVPGHNGHNGVRENSTWPI